MVFCGWNGSAFADGADIVRVEEDWRLVVSSPEPDSAGPQVTCVFSPQGNMDGPYAVFELNHRTLPEFAAGGMQLQVWDGAEALSLGEADETQLLAEDGESITWTQAMSFDGDKLKFEILSGQSNSWGEFGGEDELQASAATTLTNLNGYDPEISARKSGVGFASNRVSSLVLRRVRYFTADGQVIEDDGPRDVHVHR